MYGWDRLDRYGVPVRPVVSPVLLKRRRQCRRRHASPRLRLHRRLSPLRRCTGQLHFGFVVLLPRAASGAKQTLAPPLTVPTIPSPSRRHSLSSSPPQATPPHPAPPQSRPDLDWAVTLSESKPPPPTTRNPTAGAPSSRRRPISAPPQLD